MFFLLIAYTYWVKTVLKKTVGNLDKNLFTGWRAWSVTLEAIDKAWIQPFHLLFFLEYPEPSAVCNSPKISILNWASSILNWYLPFVAFELKPLGNPWYSHFFPWEKRQNQFQMQMVLTKSFLGLVSTWDDCVLWRPLGPSVTRYICSVALHSLQIIVQEVRPEWKPA